MNALSRLLLVFCALVFVSPALALPGDLDTTFGTGGKVLTPIGSGDDRGHAVARQSDGKIVVAGYTTNAGNKDFCVVRYNADGSLDTDFGGGDGIVSTDLGGTQDEVNGVAVQADGKIVAVGGAITGGGNYGTFALARYNTDGTPDLDFGTTGTGWMKPIVGLENNNYTKAAGVNLQPDGKILVIGTALPSASRYNFALLRYNSNGTLDNDFGVGGLALADFGINSYGQNVLVQPDGRIILAGQGDANGTFGQLARFNTDGTLDTSFGGTGKVGVTHEGQEYMTVCSRVALQIDGRLVVAGMSYNQNVSLRRYNPDGTRDMGFGVNGVVTTPVGTAQDLAYDVVVQNDGRIVAAGYAQGSTTNFAVVRYNADGSNDLGFGVNGTLTTSFSGGSAFGRGLLIAPDGRILVAGYAHDGSKNNFALVRYVGTGSLTVTAPAHGSRTNDSTPSITGQAAAGYTVNVHLDGSLSGNTVADGEGIWSYTPSSSLADGNHSVVVTETDGLGNTSPLSNVVSFTVDTLAPAAPVITIPSEAALIGSAFPVISGTAEPGAAVTVHLDGSAVGAAVASLAGAWSFTPHSALSNGLHSVRASATDGAGNTGGFSNTVSFSTLAALFGGSGALDTSFGSNGKVVTAVGTADSGSHAIVRQSDGKLIVAGYTTNAGNKDFCVVRYNVDGTLDTDFGGGDGIVSTDLGGTQDEVLGVDVQADGKIIAVGVSIIQSNSYSSFALARYNANGTLDTDFGVTGTGWLKPVVGLIVTSGTRATGVKLQSDGKVLVLGTAVPSPSRGNLALLRYNSDGTLDNGFGSGGLALADFGISSYGQNVLVQPDGRIVVAGQGDANGTFGQIARFHANGTLDNSFGGTGRVGVTHEGLEYMTVCSRVALQSDGRLVVAGMSYDQNVSLRRYNPDGTRDMGFGVNGVLTTPVGTAQDLAYDVAVQNDGRIVVAGHAYDANTNFYSFAVVRYLTNGSLDTSFQSTGKVTTPFSGGSASARGMVIAPDGRIIVAGYAHDGTKDNFALARYFGNGSLATTLPAHGSRINHSTPQLGGRATDGFVVTVYIDGSPAGTTTVDGNGDWRFTPTSPLADGAHTVAATETDGFGSTSSLSNTVSFTVDTAAPLVPVITSPVEASLVNSTWPVISGTAEAGVSVTVQIDGFAVGTAVASLAGNWNFTPANALSNGLHTLRATATDAAGNSSGFSSLVSFSTLAAILGGPGTLDTSFGTAGKVLSSFGGSDGGGNAVARQSDGKIVVAGWTTNAGNKDFCVVRYNADGALDTSFGSGGMVSTDLGGTQDEVLGVAVQDDGKIIAVGVSIIQSNSYSSFALARYNANGSLDTGFGVTGTGWLKPVVGLVVNSGARATAVKLQPDGKILVSGAALPSSSRYNLALLRYNTDGTLDNGFGSGGLALADFGSSSYGQNVLVQPDGRIVVAGQGDAHGTFGQLARFHTDGTLDTSFGGTGKVGVTHEGLEYMNVCSRVALQNDGRLVVAGMSYDQNVSLRRYNPDGTRDMGFGVNGVVTTPVGTAQDLAYDVAVQSDGRIVAAGHAYDANTNFYSFAVVRYQANGSLDTSFQSTGKVTTPFSGGNAFARGMVIAPDGRIIVAGHAHDGMKNNFALARYFGTSQPPIVTTGDATGIVRTGAVLNGSVNPNSLATTAYFEYGTTTGYGSTSSGVNLGNGYLAAPTAITIGGLTDNTLYHYRLVATNAAGTTYGADATFTTAPNPPLAFTGDAANISATGATLVGTVLPNGRDTTAYFEFGLSTAYGAQTTSQIIPAAGTLENVFSALTGLVPGVTYHFRLVAINAGSPIPITGADRTFVAQAPPPVVTISGALPLSTSSVSLGGTVNPNGASTEVFFDFGVSAGSFTQSVNASPATVSGTSNVPVSGTLSGLSQGVTYYYRLRAVSPGGTTLSGTLAFKLDLLLGLTSVFPAAPPSSEGFITVNLTPAGILHGWRFVGEQQWRPSGLPVAGLTTSNREIEFRPVPGYIQPQPEPVSIVSGEAVLPFNFEYISSGATGSGGLVITLKPDNLTSGTGRAQWRLLGENDTQWRDSDVPLNGLIPGSYLVECRPVTGRATPPSVNVTVVNGQTSAVTITYFLPDAATGTPPAVLSFESITTDTTKPYAHVGQIRSTVGSSTGFVVKPRVVATAAHVVWDDGTLAALPRVEWLFQRYRGTHEPEALIPRGHYTFDGYAAQRIADNSPGDSSPQSQHLDVAAIYFNQDAGRGGYSGFLASDLSNNEFLLSNANKMLVGYPMDGISATSQGRMHATAPFNVVFSHSYNHPMDGVRTFTTNSIRSSGGNSGGPLCVQFEGGAYYPAAIYLGGDNQTVVRAIDSAVIELFNRAQTSGNGGGNQTDSGITGTSFTGVSSSSTGNVQVLIEPAEARAVVDNMGNQLARWRVGNSGSFRVHAAVRSSLIPGPYDLNLTTIAGFQTPTPQTITVTAGQQLIVTYTYAPLMTPQESWRQTFFGTPSNYGDAADTFDFDGDGFTNAQEYAAGTNPTLSGDFFKAENAQRSGSSFTVSTTGKAGRTYTLERSATLSGWSDIGGATQGPLASDGPVTLTDSAAAGGAFFYRIRVTGP